jgi:hypothetical protein
MTDLLELVDVLTLPQPERVARKIDGEWETTWVTRDALLVRLHDAVWPSGEQNGGAGGLSSTRSPADLTTCGSTRASQPPSVPGAQSQA